VALSDFGFVVFLFIRLFRDPRSKTSGDALYQYVSKVLIGSGNYQDILFAVGTEHAILSRLLPEAHAVEYDELEKYLRVLRSEIKNILANHMEFIRFRTVRIAKDFRDVSVGKVKATVLSEEMLAPGVLRQKTVFSISHTYYTQRSKHGDAEEVPFSKINITIDATLIQTGEHWYMYDPMPLFLR